MSYLKSTPKKPYLATDLLAKRLNELILHAARVCYFCLARSYARAGDSTYAIALLSVMIFFFKQKTAYEISECDWSQTCALPICVCVRVRPCVPGMLSASVRGLRARI